MSFDALKKNRNAAIEKLKSATEKMASNKYSSADDRFWTATVDKAGNGYAVIRFLPGKGDELPWIRYWDHGFKGPTGRWYIENSLTSLEQTDPVSESNAVLWNSGREEDKETARKRKRRLHYVSNIYVVSDPGNRENEGKVFLFKYGKKIFDKINDMMTPQFPGDEAVNPYDLWAGADFRLKIRNVEDYRNYDKSEFAAVAAVSSDEKRLEEIYESQHSLAAFLDPKNFKSYAELKKKLTEVLGEDATQSMSPRQLMDHDKTESAPRGRTIAEPEPESIGAGDDSDDSDDALSYFKNLAKGSQ